MAKKFPLTPDGVKAFQAEWYKSDDQQLQDDAIIASSDVTKWFSTHFELTTEQSEYFRGLPKGYLLSLGWGVASGVIGRVPLSFDNGQQAAAKGLCPKAKVSVNVSVSNAYNWQTGATTTTGTVGGTLTF